MAGEASKRTRWRCLYPNELLLLLPLWKMFKMRKLLLSPPHSLSLSLSLHVNNDFVAIAVAAADAAFPDAIAAAAASSFPFPFEPLARCVCMCRSAKLAEQPHIQTATTHQGGAGQRANGQAEVLFHLQNIQATACIALQPVRQLRGSLRSPLSLGKCPWHVNPPLPASTGVLLRCPVPCPDIEPPSRKCGPHTHTKKDTEKELSPPAGADFNPISGQATARAEVANFLAKKEKKKKIISECAPSVFGMPQEARDALGRRQRIQFAFKRVRPVE